MVQYALFNAWLHRKTVQVRASHVVKENFTVSNGDIPATRPFQWLEGCDIFFWRFELSNTAPSLADALVLGQVD